MIVMKRKYHLHEARRKTPASTSAMVLARALAMPKSASFLACSAGSGYIWTTPGSAPSHSSKPSLNSPIMLIDEGMVQTAKSADTARRTKNAYWSVMNEMMR
jgi:hypothetical protein